MNLKTNLFEDYIKFVDSTTKQNTYFKIIISFFVIKIFFDLFFVFFIYLIEYISYINPLGQKTAQKGNLDCNLIL